MSDKLELPKSWEIAKLGQLWNTTSGGTPSRKEMHYFQGNIPWVKSGELEHNVIVNTEEKITEEALKNSSAKIFPKGTLLIALYGATIGKLAFLGIDASSNQAVCGIYTNQHLSSHFLYYFLFFKRPNLVKESIGGAQPNISQGILKNLDVPLPPLPEQHRIVEKIEALFSELDNGVEQLKTAQQQLKVYRQSVLKWAFEGKQKVTWNKLVLNEICDQTRGITYGVIKLGKYVQNGIPCLRTSDVRFLKIETDNVKKISDNISNNFKRTILQGGEILVNVRGTLGGVAVVPDKFKSWNISREVAMVPITKDINEYFIAYQIASIKSQNWLNKVTKGIAYAGINLSDLRNLPITLPLLEEQHQIVQEIETRLSVCDKLEETITASLQQAEALRQSILKKAFEGKLVPQNPNDEPASVLLERIREEKKEK